MNRQLLIFFCGAICTFSSCYSPRYVYSPAAHNVPVLTRKGDSKVAAYYSGNLGKQSENTSQVTDNKSSGLDAQAAYAISNHWALQASYSLRNERNGGNFSLFNTDSAVIRYNRSLAEFGVGYFKVLSENRRAIFQVFSGIGFGRFSIKDNGKDAGGTYYNRFHDMDVFKFYVQPAMVLNGTKFFSVALSSRFSFLKFNKIKTDYTLMELENYQLSNLGSGTVTFWEPAFVNSFWLKKLPYLKLEYQAQLSILMSHKFVDSRAFGFSAGIVFDPVLMHRLKRNRSVRQSN